MTAKSDRCEKLVNDPDLKQAFEDVRLALHQAFAECPTNDSESMVDIRKRLHLLDSVEANLHRAVQDGKLEDFRAIEDERPPVLGDILKWRKKNQ
jgi:hypothetical protein